MPLSYHTPGVEEIRWLRDAFGDELMLTDGDDDTDTYRVLAEFTYHGRPYAALQSKAMLKEEHDVAFFRLLRSGDQVNLETIEDDDEWETVSEVFDDMWFA